jgi:hypothetical protein
VDDNATGANDGSSWTDAYNFLQDALADANSVEKPIEIRIAQGTYKPNEGLMAIPEFNWRTVTFQLINGVSLMGGYAGVGVSDPDVRNVELYETILSGDLNGDDVEVVNLEDLWEEPTRAENSFHVVTGSQTDETAVLDGFTITGGNANGEDQDYFIGGGLYNDGSSPTLIKCTFTKNTGYLGVGMANWDSSGPTLIQCKFSGNSAEDGGGMFNGSASDPTLINCTFNGNTAQVGGGGMFNSNSSPTLTDCTFSENSAGLGGGMNNWDNSSPTLTNCIFSGNSAEDGGGMYNASECSPTLTNCIFSGNSSEYDGGGMYAAGFWSTLNNCVFSENSARNGGGMSFIFGRAVLTNCSFSSNSAREDGGGMYNGGASNPSLTQCTFDGNSAQRRGGGMYNYYSFGSTLANCRFSGNSAEYGGGMYNDEQAYPTVKNCSFAHNSAQHGNALACDSYNQYYRTFKLINCILWDGGDEIWNNDNSTIVVTFSNVQGGFPGEGNIDVDPCFVEPGYWDPNGTPDDPNDDFWVDDDYHLKSQAGRWNPASESWAKDDLISPCIDAGDPNSPIGNEPFPNGGIVNMGAYGGTAEASKSYFGEPVCETIVAGDINGDCKVNLSDFAIMALHWLEDNNP